MRTAIDWLWRLWCFFTDRPALYGRAAGWPKVRDEWIAEHPTCAACGTTRDLEAHHMVPVTFDPSMELDRGNLLTLCGYGANSCHLRIGHCGNWSQRNPQAMRDARDSLRLYGNGQSREEYRQLRKVPC